MTLGSNRIVKNFENRTLNAISPDGKFVMMSVDSSRMSDGLLREIWNMETGKVVQVYRIQDYDYPLAGEFDFSKFALSGGAEFLAFNSFKRSDFTDSVEILKKGSKKIFKSIPLPYRADLLSLSFDGKYLGVEGLDKDGLSKLSVFDVKTAKKLELKRGVYEGIYWMQFKPPVKKQKIQMSPKDVNT